MNLPLTQPLFRGALLLTLLLPAPLLAVVDPPPPAATTLTTPSGSLTERQPEFAWSAVPNATWYQVWIDRGGANYVKVWVEAATTWQPAEDLSPGDYAWWIRTWGPGGMGPWSAPGAFQVEAHIPGATAPVAPAGLITNRQPTFSWNAVTHATWYQLWIVKDGAQYFTGWIADATTWQPAEALGPGTYTWWVKTWGPDGTGPWSAPGIFFIETTLPAATSLVAPAGLITNRQPQFQWTAVEHASWYKIHINRNGVKHTTEWINGATAWTPAGNLSAGDYSWWVMTWNADGNGPWSAEETFSIEPILPGPASPIDPTNVTLGPDAGERRPWFNWTSATGATWYRLHLYQDGGLYGQYWVAGATSWRPASPLPGGVFTWKVETWNEDGYGPVSDFLAFTVAVSAYHDLEQRAHLLVNNYRNAQSLPTLSWNETIAQVCRGHSQDMADGVVPFGHTGSQARVNQIGLTISWVAAGENVAWNQGYPQPADTAVELWIGSPGHRANMVGNYNLTGMGVARSNNGKYYFTQIFILE